MNDPTTSEAPPAPPPSADDWRQLQRRSNADPLFLGWEWQRVWWQCYGSALPEAQLQTVTARAADGALSALAPLYVHRARRLPLLNLRSLQLVGGAWRDDRVMLSEYLEPLCATTGGKPGQLLSRMAQLEWDEFVATLTPRDGQFHDALRSWCTENRWLLRELDVSESYQAHLGAGFDAYTRALPAGARRRLLNNRARLRQQGEVTLRTLDAADVMAGLDTLNALHARRWRQAAYDTGRLEFLRALHAILPEGAMPIVSLMEVADSVVSALYDIRVGTRQYNLQMGFDPAFDRSVSLGLLHLGHAMEQAAAARVDCYDFLGGSGKHTNYKARISTGTRALATLQVVRHPAASAIYRVRDLARGRTPLNPR
ncbi:MAG TPA: GNAT family N-acetyltransferase [Steroidobacteraceae bacterium]|nr:GNAT family N-acetyltransferase [Steroidobacteraceae bacterium]